MSAWIRHPDLPGRRVEVPEGSVPHYRASGWVLAEAPPKFRRAKPEESAAPAKTTAPDAEAAPVVADSKTDPESPKPRRRTTKEGD